MVRKLLWGIVACMFCLAAEAQAGRIELGGKWYTLEEIIPEGGLIRTHERPSGLQSFTGVESNLLEQPARIVALLGDRWVGAQPHLTERFWPLVDFGPIIRGWDSRFGVRFKKELPIKIEKESGSYELVVTADLSDLDGVMKLFRRLVFAAEMAEGNMMEQRCIAFSGRLTWSGMYNRKEEAKSKYEYRFLIERVTISNGWIPTAYSGGKSLSLEDATEVCADALSVDVTGRR